jgi:hypothetical protein
MKAYLLSFIFAFLSVFALGQVLPRAQSNSAHVGPPLDYRVEHFDLSDAILRDGVAELGSNPVDGLHLGLEEVLRGKIQEDPRTASPHFSLHLRDKTVREILDAICGSDSRYIWSVDGASVNIYPRSAIADPSYLPNFRLNKMALMRITDPDLALPAIGQQYPDEQIGYMQAGGNISYVEPWTVSFEQLTVRQFVNRLAEHIGPRSSWIWQGGRDERMFTFQRGGFHTSATQ